MSLNNNINIIYTEEEALNYPTGKKIIKNNPNSKIIEIGHYKDIFCRPKQNYNLQHKCKNIILAVKKDNFVYKGSNVCQAFGEDRENFYYTSLVANCICDCEYCYLKGMYDCGFLCVFVNIEDYFKNLDNMLKKNNIYLCATYDTDLFPLEKSLSYIKKLSNYANTHNDNNKLKVEIRTKFKNLDIWKYKIPNNVIFAFSMSPNCIIDLYERKTSRLNARIENINKAIEAGVYVRLCFDPVIKCKNFEEEYTNFFNYLYEKIDFTKIKDASIGSFRISKTYLNKLKSYSQDSKLLNYPFANIEGYYQYPEKTRKYLENFVANKLSKVLDPNKIYTWK